MTQDFQAKIKELVIKACREKKDSHSRLRYLTEIIRLIQKSNKLWRESTPYYEDALQQTWLYLCSNLCEATTAKEAYDPEQSLITTWLNNYLKYRLRDAYRENQKEKATRYNSNDENYNPLDHIPNPPDTPPILEQVREWAETDPDGELEKTHIRGRKDLTAKKLILKRLPPETSWQELAEESNVGISTLSTFYERKCRPLLRKFGETNGYLS
jgi:hypothetical protein